MFDTVCEFIPNGSNFRDNPRQFSFRNVLSRENQHSEENPQLQVTIIHDPIATPQLTCLQFLLHLLRNRFVWIVPRASDGANRVWRRWRIATARFANRAIHEGASLGDFSHISYSRLRHMILQPFPVVPQVRLNGRKNGLTWRNTHERYFSWSRAFKGDPLSIFSYRCVVWLTLGDFLQLTGGVHPHCFRDLAILTHGGET